MLESSFDRRACGQCAENNPAVNGQLLTAQLSAYSAGHRVIGNSRAGFYPSETIICRRRDSTAPKRFQSRHMGNAK
jgi:hypothetical protein